MATPGHVPELKLGERAFEIVLARQMASRRGRDAVVRAARVDADHRDPGSTGRRSTGRSSSGGSRSSSATANIGLIERPECKRRWQSEPWEEKEQAALTTWLLDRCEDRALWFGAGRRQPRPMTVNRLADRLRTDADVVSVARCCDGPDADLADVLKEIIADEHVPFLAALPLQGRPACASARQWERTWDLQREEDATGKKLDIAGAAEVRGRRLPEAVLLAPPRQARRAEGAVHLLPRRQPGQRRSLLLGWAGWDHREQAQP